MRRRRRKARLRLEAACFLHSRPIDEVREVLVIDDYWHTFEWRRLPLPARERRLPAFEERLAAGLVSVRVCGIDLTQTVSQRSSDLRNIAGISVNVRIASRVKVAERTVDDLWDFEPGDVLRGFEVPRTPELDLAVSALGEQQRNPANLQLRARADEQIGRADARDQAGTRFDTVRVLQRSRRRVHVHLVATDLLSEGSPLRFASEDIEGC